MTTLGYLLLRPRWKEKRRNKIDEWWTTQICERVQKSVSNARIWSECFYRVTIALSDQQLVTGIAILMAAFILRARGNIIAHHFSIVRDMAFFSSIAHTLSLLALWSSMGSWRSRPERKKNGRRFPVPLVTIWRLVCMMAMFGLLMAAVWITAPQLFEDWVSCPVQCIPMGPQHLHGSPFRWAVASTYFLITNYGTFLLLFTEQLWGPFETLRNRVHQHTAKLPRFVQSFGRWTRYVYYSEIWTLVEAMGWFIANCGVRCSEPFIQ